MLATISRLSLLTVALALGTLIAARDAPTAIAIGSFNPTLEVTLSSTTPGVSADMTSVFTIPTGDYLGVEPFRRLTVA